MPAFSAIVRERLLPSESENEYPFEVVVMMNDEPVLLCRHRLELREDWHMRDRDFNVWKTVEPPAVWIEKCKTLQEAKKVATRRSVVLNKLADLFDADTAVSLYRSWESYA